MDGYAVRAADVVRRAGAGLMSIGVSAAGRGYRRRGRASDRPCVSSPAHRCRRAPTRSSSRRIPRPSGGERHRGVRDGGGRAGNIRRRGLDFSAGRQAAGRKAACSDAAALSLAAIGQSRERSMWSAGRWSPLSPRATNCCRRAASSDRTRSSRRTPMASPRSPRRPVRGVPRPRHCRRRPQMPSRRDWREATQAGADVIVTLGGASVGDHDLVHEVLGRRRRQARFLEDRHAARQAADVRAAGRDTIHRHAGQSGGQPCLLPPLSEAACRATRRTQGEAGHPPGRALGAAMPANDLRQDYVRAKVDVVNGQLTATPFGIQDSSMLRILADSGGLIIREPFAPAGQSRCLLHGADAAIAGNQSSNQAGRASII